MQLTFRKGTTNKVVRILLDKTGLADDLTKVQAFFIGEGDSSPTSITLRPATTDAFTPGALREIDPDAMPGLYELHVPDEALAVSGHTSVLMLQASGSAPAIVHFDLVAYDPYDGERLGLACLSKDSRHACLEAAFRDVVPDIVSELQER